MTIDEFFVWLAEYCRPKSYHLSAAAVCAMADDKGIELGFITQVGRKHLLPRGWAKHRTTSGKSLYSPPEVKEDKET